MQLLFASQNKHKRDELLQVLSPQITLRTLSELGFTDELQEDYSTIEENALQKARFAYAKYAMNVISEDTALEVEALNGAPGVNTAHYAGPLRNAKDNIELLLNNMKNQTNRNARFRTIICLIENGKEYLFEGICEGTISTSISGSEGFGYDPVFIPKGSLKTFAELSQQEKISMSHRTKAALALKHFLLKEH
jgi:XTP/dITP diphosphohydrolase